MVPTITQHASLASGVRPPPPSDADQARARTGYEDEGGVGLEQRQPVGEGRRRPEREILIVERTLAAQRAGADHQRVVAARGDRGAVGGGQVLDVAAVERGEVGGHGVRVPRGPRPRWLGVCR
jgi:hypothetical protein